MTPEEYLANEPLGLAVLERVKAILEPSGRFEVRASKSQVAFRRRRGFAFLWLPERYLRRPAPLVLSIALGRADPSSRFKQVIHVAPAHWMHHLELRALEDVDEEVGGWLLEAASRAG
jgi:Domain of unknown function (DUF5655)